MTPLIIVEGNDCLEYIDKPIGFASHDYIVHGNLPVQAGPGFMDYYSINNSYNQGEQRNHTMNQVSKICTTLQKWSHDVNKRVVGLVLGDSPDGGLEVAILGNETIANSSINGNIDWYGVYLINSNTYYYDSPLLPTGEYTLSTQKTGGYPEYPGPSSVVVNNRNIQMGWSSIDFDDAIDYNPTDRPEGFVQKQPFGSVWEYAHNQTEAGATYTITNNKDNTMVFGVIVDLPEYLYYPKECMENPLNMIGGNLYNALGNFNFFLEGTMPQRVPLGIDFDDLKFPSSETEWLERTNFTALPFNLILTRSEQMAKNYLTNGTLPTDAWLYPLDWDNLPRYEDPVPTGDTPDDEPNDNTPDDDTRDFDPTPLETPSFTVNQLTNYNWYWLTVPEWSGFINWFWNDIGDFSDFDDIIAKVKGLYNDLSSAVIMCRYYPVDVSWIGGTGTQSNIKIGMIEKSGNVDTLANTSLRAQDIGHVHISKKYKSFMDMSPYSQLSLYLPFHGFIDLDMDLFNGHDLYVKALYDYMSGTIQYYIFYDNSVLVNTILCKMAMDIPVTLQTKNDRDSAIFNNVSSTIGGLVGAGVGIASGNPIGMALGVTQGVSAFNSANASAPMRLMGNVGESGAYIGCQNCFIVVRRPTIQPSDGNSESSVGKNLNTWKKNIGQLCGYGYKLEQLNGKGFTVCQSPRINFTSTTPLQTEVDEIYDYLSKGVIL